MEEEYQGAQVIAPWEGVCHRCGKEANTYTMSWFNQEYICMECNDKEEAHPDIELAKDVEVAHVKAGNFNYPGIGFPGYDGRVTIDYAALYPNTIHSSIVEEEE